MTCPTQTQTTAVWLPCLELAVQLQVNAQSQILNYGGEVDGRGKEKGCVIRPLLSSLITQQSTCEHVL